jgi:hypothetical protein
MKNISDMTLNSSGVFLSIFGISLHGNELTELCAIGSAISGLVLVFLGVVKFFFDMKIKLDNKERSKAESRKAIAEAAIAEMELEEKLEKKKLIKQ